MYALFISDLHLSEAHPELTRLFLQFLETQAKTADALYILGDFFEMWLGDDDDSPLIKNVAQALKQLTASGVPVYLMHGNRDFLIGERFLAATGCRLLPDPSVIDLYGVRALLMHGDTLCTGDKSYQRFRKIARNPYLQRFFLKLPLSIRRLIANRLRRQSAQKDNCLISDTVSSTVMKIVKEKQVSLLIHGHTHRPEIQLILGDFSFEKIVLSDWEKTGNALFCYPKSIYRLVYYSLALAKR